ncbi:MAG: undecaprenyl/decaprenyl-phosphate alpha-N-acetylglucosaminyl 1-phosphate transferase [Phycisphaerae bacterium]|nr:undecaprenyl/decaprenyl-phosphate alpha-N-acetylglucosaminyl 1-phosphate transferase [Phycisphaerae bacterium]
MSPVLPIACLATSFAISAAASAVVRRWAQRRGFVDRPGGHKAHAREVALGGGIAIVAAVILPMLAIFVVAQVLSRGSVESLPALVRTHLGGVLSKSSEGTAIVAGAIVLHILGLLDDLRPVSAVLRFIVQLAVAFILAAFFDVRLLTLLSPPLSIALTVLWIVVIINAFNFLDNMDGLAAGVGFIAIGVFSLVAVGTSQIFVPACCWLLAGALIGFLPFNWPPATLFLGDAGSTVIGYLIAILTILTTFYDPTSNQQPTGVLAPLVVMAVPLYDTLSVVLIRWRAGDSVWRGDRRHFSHRLVRRGMSPRTAVLFIWMATLATALPAIILPHATGWVAMIIALETVAVVALVALMEFAPRSDA